jgi:HK97 family phage major capsid protein/HK97 family phage prohead protease
MATLEIKFAPEADGEIAGYASLFGGPADAVGDIVSPGAFADSLADGLPAMLREHKGQPVGEWLDVAEDDIGLRVRGRVTDPATLADLRAGRLDGLSIGYIATKAHRDTKGRRVLDAVNLEEISLVRRPASSRARVLSVKSCAAGDKTMSDQTSAAPGEPDGDEMDARMGKVETGLADHEKRLSAIEANTAKAVKSLDRVETMLRRPGAAVETKAADDKAEVKTFERFLRHGREALDVAEVKSLRIADDTGAGYLAPAEFVAEIVKNIVLVSPVRSVARVMTTSAPNVILPRRTATTTAKWVGETETRTETDPAYGALEFPVREMSAYSDISNAMLEDAAFDLSGELASDLAEQFGKSEGAAFVNGTGVKQPFGFMSSPDILSVNSGSGTAITADSLLDLFHALPTFYAANAVWGMNRTTLGAVRKLKDGQGRYLVDIAGMGNAPVTTLLGRPVLELPDMPDVAGGAYPVVIGDFKSGYRIFDRLSLAILRDPYSQQTNGLVRFHARRRVAGSVAKAEAFRKLKISA